MTDDASVTPMDHHQTVSVVAAVAPVGETTENGPNARRFTADMPDLDLDSELRAAVFARVQRLREQYGKRIPSAELSAGVTFRGARVPIWNYQKGIFKPAALGRDGAALSIQTSADSPHEDDRDPEAGHFIYKYRGTDPDHHDNRALRRARELRRPLVYFVAVDASYFDAVLPVYVTSDDPLSMQVTLVADQPSAGLQFVDTQIAEVGRAYATRAVMQRLHQQQFRRVVLSAYRDRCAICRLNYLELLDAAHILEDKHPRGEPVVSNGLGMCKIHHSAFDANILGIDPDARVHIRVDVLKKKDGPMLRHGLQELNGTRLVLPKREELRPNRGLWRSGSIGSGPPRRPGVGEWRDADRFRNSNPASPPNIKRF